MLVVYIALLIILFSVCDNAKSKKYYVPLKMICSGAFLVILGICTYKSNTPKIGLGLIPSFIFCFAGDLFMGIFYLKKRSKYIIGGIVTFFLAHVGFLIEMYLIEPSANIGIIMIPIIMLVVLSVGRIKLHMHFGKALVPVYIYTAVVSSLLAKGMQMLSLGGTSYIRIGIATLLFFLSDFALAFQDFYHFKDKGMKKKIHIFNLSTYYMAMYIFCNAVLFWK